MSQTISPDSSHQGCYTIFFFSSRRRHTRCGRDWSSDVCSSDLLVVARVAADHGDGLPDAHRLVRLDARAAEFRHRSEERRVGKEGRVRLGADEEKKME